MEYKCLLTKFVTPDNYCFSFGKFLITKIIAVNRYISIILIKFYENESMVHNYTFKCCYIQIFLFVPLKDKHLAILRCPDIMPNSPNGTDSPSALLPLQETLLPVYTHGQFQGFNFVLRNHKI